jgi:hypothetical protein
MCVTYLENYSGMKLIILNYNSTTYTASSLSEFYGYIKRVMILHELSEGCFPEEIGKLGF